MIVQCAIFSSLFPKEIQEVNYMKDSSMYKKGQVIFYEGNHPKGIYVVYSGKVKVYKLGSNVKNQIVRLAKPWGGVLGYRSLMSEDRYHASAEALEDSVVCFIPKDQLMELMKKKQCTAYQHDEGAEPRPGAGRAENGGAYAEACKGKSC